MKKLKKRFFIVEKRSLDYSDVLRKKCLFKVLFAERFYERVWHYWVLNKSTQKTVYHFFFSFLGHPSFEHLVAFLQI